MGRASSSAGWSRRGKSSRTSRCGRRAIGRTASSPVRISTGTGNAEPTSAPAGNCCRPVAPCMTDVRCCTAHQSGTAIYARYERSAAPRPMRARSPRDLHEDARDIARRKMKTKAFAKSRDERKRVEMRFAHLKTHHGFERMRLRGLSGARDEFHLAAIVQNLKTLALRTLGHRQPDGAHRLPEIA